MNCFRLIVFVVVSLALNACSTLSSITSKDKKLHNQYLPEYVAISPISLPPIAGEMKAELQNIATNIKGAETIPYDMDLLVLPASLSKVQYEFFHLKSSASGGGIASISGEGDRSKTIYDLMHMASHPLQVVLKPLDKNSTEATVIVTPFIGVGVRIIADYKLDKSKANLSLSALAAEIEANNGNGSIEIQQLGISRYGSSNQGATGVNLTPENLEGALKSIGYMMGQIWLQDTRVQPMIVGYSVPGYSNIDSAYHPYIVEQLIARKDEIMFPFIESMFYEAKNALNINGKLEAKSQNDNTDYNAKLLAIKETISKERDKVALLSEIALERPKDIPKINSKLVENALENNKFDQSASKHSIYSTLELRDGAIK